MQSSHALRQLCALRGGPAIPGDFCRGCSTSCGRGCWACSPPLPCLASWQHRTLAASPPAPLHARDVSGVDAELPSLPAGSFSEPSGALRGYRQRWQCLVRPCTSVASSSLSLWPELPLLHLIGNGAAGLALVRQQRDLPPFKLERNQEISIANKRQVSFLWVQRETGK